MGTEEFWVPAVLAAVGTGTEYVNQKQAANRQDAAEAQSIMDQQALQQKATARAGQEVKSIEQSNPNAIQSQATGQYVNQLRRNAAGSARPGKSSALAPASGASGRYAADTAAGQAATSNFGDELASTMAGIDAPVRQRQNEALGMQDLQTDLNTTNAQSYATNFIDQLKAQAAGQANPWVSLFGSLLKNGALAYASSAGGAGKGLTHTTKVPTSMVDTPVGWGSTATAGLA